MPGCVNWRLHGFLDNMFFYVHLLVLLSSCFLITISYVCTIMRDAINKLWCFPPMERRLHNNTIILDYAP